MGKASRWLVNFLLGRKEEKGKRKNISISFEETPAASPTASPFKRRWSFGKLAIKEKVHKSFRSFDSRTATPLVKQAVSSLKQRQDSTRVLAMAMSSATKRKTTATKYTAAWITKAVEDAAAIRIQAAFRSYLARKALHALRGLVKLQALVRGHQVRKQTTATLRRMHALMAIQVRARFQRVQMAEDPQLAVKSHSSRSGRFTLEMGFKRPEREAFDVNLYEKHGIVKSQNGFMNHSQIGTIEHGITTYYSGELSISKREQKYEEFSFTTHNSPRHFPAASSMPTPGRSSFSSHHEDPYTPNYMAKTESSKAKVEFSRAKLRSQSEPKQRPKAKGKITSSAEEMNDYIQQKNLSSDEEMNDYNQQKHSSSQSKGIVDENQEPWFANVYRSSRAANDEECYASGRTNYSEYRKSLVTNEPHATLF